MRRLDEIDQALVSLLRADARLPTASLARHVGLSRSAVQERLVRLERDGVIRGYTLVLAETAALPFQARVMITIDPKRQDRVVEALRGLPAVTRCDTVGGAFDLIAEVAAESGADLDAVLTRIGRLPGVERTVSAILLTPLFRL